MDTCIYCGILLKYHVSSEVIDGKVKCICKAVLNAPTRIVSGSASVE